VFIWGGDQRSEGSPDASIDVSGDVSSDSTGIPSNGGLFEAGSAEVGIDAEVPATAGLVVARSRRFDPVVL
jgi:hypothetical protein